MSPTVPPISVITKSYPSFIPSVGYVGYYLNGLSQIVSAPLLIYDVLVYAPGGNVVRARSADVRETLVMPEVEVRLFPVYRYIALPVLIRIERSRIDVDIGVELLYRNLESPRLEQLCQRCRNYPFTQRRYYSARNKYILCLHYPVLFILILFYARKSK